MTPPMSTVVGRPAVTDPTPAKTPAAIVDRLATELMLLRGSDREGGSAGFGLATDNDAPFASKGHIVATAVEAATRRPLSLRTREVANLVGILAERIEGSATAAAGERPCPPPPHRPRSGGRRRLADARHGAAVAR